MRVTVLRKVRLEPKRSCQQICVHIRESVQKGNEQYNTVTEDNAERHVCTCTKKETGSYHNVRPRSFEFAR